MLAKDSQAEQGRPVVEAASSSEPASAAGEPQVQELPVLPVRGVVVFPGGVLPLVVSRPSSIKLLDEFLPQSKTIAAPSEMRRRMIPGLKTFLPRVVRSMC